MQIGCDLVNISPETMEILTNDLIIAVNQDPLGIQGHRVAAQSVDEHGVMRQQAAQTAVWIQPCNGSPGQQWTVVRAAARLPWSECLYVMV